MSRLDDWLTKHGDREKLTFEAMPEIVRASDSRSKVSKLSLESVCLIISGEKHWEPDAPSA